MNGDLRLDFASDDFAGTKWKNLTGTTRWSTARISPACFGGCARAFRPGWTRWKPGRPSGGRRIHKKLADARRRTIKAVYKDPRFRQHRADAAAGPARPQHLQRGGEGVSARPPGEPAAERLQQLLASGAHEPAAGDLADMKAFGNPSCWWPSTRSPRKWRGAAEGVVRKGSL